LGLEFLVPIFGILIVLVPIIGVTTILTLRFGLKPFVETLAAELRGSGFAGSPELQGQVEELSEQVALMAAELRRLREGQDFDRRLLEGTGPDPSEGRSSS
jgi:hypothetical protein